MFFFFSFFFKTNSSNEKSVKIGKSYQKNQTRFSNLKHGFMSSIQICSMQGKRDRTKAFDAFCVR